MKHTRLLALACVSAVTLLAAGCSAGQDDTAPEEFPVSVDQTLADTVPQKFKDAGKLVIATDPTYPPFETVSEDNAVIGLDADLGKAIGDLLGLKVEFQKVSFDGIIPALQAGSADMALSSIGDNKEREEVVDFATAYWNGTLLLTTDGNPRGGTPQMACDMKVGVARGSLQQTTFLPAQAGPCADAGKAAPKEFAYQNSNQAVLALSNGRIDAVLADAPVVALAVSQTTGLESVGPIARNPNPAGAAMKKDSGLAKPVSEAINALIADGTYGKILKKWKLSDIAIEQSEVNGAQE